VVFYESPHRLLKSLADIASVLGMRKIVVLRELTKKFEQILRGSAEELLEHFKEHAPKGEFVIVIKGKNK
jgi:16S rRNA (cytidine1402-2'-O)-methyltransferase